MDCQVLITTDPTDGHVIVTVHKEHANGDIETFMVSLAVDEEIVE